MNENIKNIESVEEENGIDFGAIWLAMENLCYCGTYFYGAWSGIFLE